MIRPSAPSPSVLVLGATGFLGRHVVEAVLHAGPPTPDAGGTPFLASIARRSLAGFGGAVTEVEHDLATGDAGDLVRRFEPREVIHLAALSRVGDCERDPELARRLNATVPRELAVACRDVGTRLVAVSTDLVFDGEPPRPTGYAEEDAARPRHVYGATKAAGEEAVLEANPDALVVRLPLLFGESFGRGLGASDGLLRVLEEGGEATLFTDEWRTPLDAADAARALVELARTDAKGLLHVAGPERVNRLELGHAVVDVALAQLRQLRPGVDVAAGYRERLVAGRRADLGMENRPADTSLDASRALGLLKTPLLGVRDWVGRAAGSGPMG